MASKKYAKVNTKRCVACGVCVKECPKSAIHIFKGCFAVIVTSKFTLYLH